METFTRPQTAIVYFRRGEDFIKDAQFLFNSHVEYKTSIISCGLLLLQGIELLLKSFIIIKDKNENFEEVLHYLQYNYGHKYIKIYQKCLALDDDKLISNKELGEDLEFLNDNFADNYVELRYPNSATHRYIPEDIFQDVDNYLIKPLHLLTVEYDKNR